MLMNENSELRSFVSCSKNFSKNIINKSIKNNIVPINNDGGVKSKRKHRGFIPSTFAATLTCIKFSLFIKTAFLINSLTNIIFIIPINIVTLSHTKFTLPIKTYSLFYFFATISSYILFLIVTCIFFISLFLIVACSLMRIVFPVVFFIVIRILIQISNISPINISFSSSFISFICISFISFIISSIFTSFTGLFILYNTVITI